MRVNKITPNMVKDAITFDVFWKDNKDIIENTNNGIKKTNMKGG